MEKMKAIVCTKYGPPEVLKLKEVNKPIPKSNEALIKVYASSVTTGDCRIRRFDFAKWFWLPGRIIFGFTKPRSNIPGWELSGKIESIGKDVKRFKKGDKVFGYNKGISFGSTNAEYKCLSEDRLAGRTYWTNCENSPYFYKLNLENCWYWRQVLPM